MLAEIGRLQVRHDPDATAAAYRALATGAYEACTCKDCRNFAALGERAYPAEAHALFRQLGIDYRFPAEVYNEAPHERGNGWQGQAGWFHFVGELTSEAGVGVIEVPPEFRYWLHAAPQLVPAPFRHGTSLVQLEFHAVVPWVLIDPPAE